MLEGLKNGLGKNRKLLGDTAWSIAAKGVSMVFFFGADIAVARLLTYEQYDEWNYAYAIISVCFWIVWFGLPTSTRVHVASFREDPLRQNSAIVSGMKLRIWMSLAFVPVLLILGSIAARWLGYPGKYPHLLALLLGGVGLIFVNSFSETFKTLYVGLVDFRSQFAVMVAEYAGIFVFGIVCLWLMRSLNGLMLGYVLGTLSAVLVGFYLIKRHFAARSGRLAKQEEKDIGKQIFRYALPLLASSIGTMILMEMDSVMLGSMRAGEVGIYSVAKKIVSKADHINFALCAALMTPFAIITRENVSAKWKLYQKIMGLNILVTVCVAGAFWVAGEWLIVKLYGAQYQNVGLVLNSLLPYYCMYAISMFSGALLDYQHKAKLRSILLLTVVVLNLVLNYCLIPPYGAMGAAWATSISMLPYTILSLLESVKIFRDTQRLPEGTAGE